MGELNLPFHFNELQKIIFIPVVNGYWFLWSLLLSKEVKGVNSWAERIQKLFFNF